MNLKLFDRRLFSASNLVYGDGVADDSGNSNGSSTSSGVGNDVRVCKMKTALKI